MGAAPSNRIRSKPLQKARKGEASQAAGRTQRKDALLQLYSQNFTHARAILSERLLFNAFIATIVGACLAFSGPQPNSVKIILLGFLVLMSTLGLVIVEATRVPWLQHMRTAERIVICEWRLWNYSTYFADDLERFGKEKENRSFLEKTYRSLPATLREQCQEFLKKKQKPLRHSRKVSETKGKASGHTPMRKMASMTRITQFFFGSLVFILIGLIFCFLDQDLLKTLPALAILFGFSPALFLAVMMAPCAAVVAYLVLRLKLREEEIITGHFRKVLSYFKSHSTD